MDRLKLKLPNSSAKFLDVDDKILHSAVADVTSYVSVLSMVDPASGATMYKLRKAMSALEASAIIFCNWICRFRIPSKLSSDNHGSFNAEVAKLICKILGVENRIFSAVYQSRSQAHVENRNRIISETLNGADSKRDITCDMDLELYIAEAEIKANQLIVTDGSTDFERCSREPPRTVNTSLAAPAVENSRSLHESTAWTGQSVARKQRYMDSMWIIRTPLDSI